MHKPNAAATLNSPFPQPKDDTFTISAISVLAAIIASILHEGFGARRSRGWSPRQERSSTSSPPSSSGWLCATRLSVRWRLLLFLCLAFNLFDCTGYFFFSGVTILAPTFRNFLIFNSLLRRPGQRGANFSPFPTYDLNSPICKVARRRFLGATISRASGPREAFVRVNTLLCLAIASIPSITTAQSCLDSAPPLTAITQSHDYVQKRSSSYDRSGANADMRPVAPGETLTVMDENGPGAITHIWFTIATPEAFHLKKLVLRIYWDSESTPSVEAPIGDFFGLGLGDYFLYASTPLQVGPDKALNSFFVMPFQKHARITVTNEGQQKVGALYFNIDYRACGKPFPADTVYFHAQYRQASPNRGWTSDWTNNGDPKVNNKTNLTGEDNYVWLEATGRGHFAGVTMSVLQNQDYWWGEGDDMFFVDGEKTPSINGTGSEDYFLGAWDFGGGHSFSYPLMGALIVGEERAGGHSSLYRFHLDSPITFTKSFKASIEHGHANHRSDNFFSVAYWYQTEPHAPFPALPPVSDRLPRLHPTGGPGNAGPGSPTP